MNCATTTLSDEILKILGLGLEELAHIISEINRLREHNQDPDRIIIPCPRFELRGVPVTFGHAMSDGDRPIVFGKKKAFHLDP